MTARQLVPALRYLCHTIARPGSDEASDAQLLERFVLAREEIAFELLARRHGPMIFGVCRRLLQDVHAAEDAYQATFLTLARKAGSIRRRRSVGCWLYQVAYRIALRARTQARRLAQRERQVGELPPVVAPAADPAWRELRAVIDDEVSRLPNRYQRPVVLCYLEGLSNGEAARQLGCPPGTLKTRLAHARRILAGRLTRRGLALGALLLAEGALPSQACTPVPAALMQATLRSAAGKLAVLPTRVIALSEGVVRTMTMMKLKLAALILTGGILALGTGVTTYQARATETSDDTKASAPQQAADRAEQLRKEIAQMQETLARADEIKKELVEKQEALRRTEKELTASARLVPRPSPVAMIFDTEPITREELADHLIARMTRQDLDAYINQRIVQHACRQRGITVTDAEVKTLLETEAQSMKLSADKLADIILKQQHKTMEEWLEDVIRPRLLMEKLCRASIPVSEEELHHIYEALYGKRAECEGIFWQTAHKDAAARGLRQLRKGAVTFDELSRRTADPNSGTQVIPFRIIGRHSTGIDALEDAALTLAPGEVSDLVEIPGGFILLKCVRRIPADTAIWFEDVRGTLERECRERKQQQDVPKAMQALKEQAKIRILWEPK